MAIPRILLASTIAAIAVIALASFPGFQSAPRLSLSALFDPDKGIAANIVSREDTGETVTFQPGEDIGGTGLIACGTATFKVQKLLIRDGISTFSFTAPAELASCANPDASVCPPEAPVCRGCICLPPAGPLECEASGGHCDIAYEQTTPSGSFSSGSCHLAEEDVIGVCTGKVETTLPDGTHVVSAGLCCTPLSKGPQTGGGPPAGPTTGPSSGGEPPKGPTTSSDEPTGPPTSSGATIVDEEPDEPAPGNVGQDAGDAPPPGTVAPA